MMDPESRAIIEEYHLYLNQRAFPCLGAKAAMAKQQLHCMVADSIDTGSDDTAILKFLYDCVDAYRSDDTRFYSAAIIFKKPLLFDEEIFDRYMWQRLQALHELDSARYAYDKRVDPDPGSAHFSFSLKEEAFFIIGMHALSSRPSRRFRYPTLTFNPHRQFVVLRATNKYESLKDVVRKRDLEFSGSVNPMLDDFGKSSEVYQYSGRHYDHEWRCPLIIKKWKI
jgi:FPC/CPF motif-containing protein YcgG